HHHVGGGVLRERHRLISSRRLAHDVDVGRFGEHRLQPRPHDGVIVYQHDTNAHDRSLSGVSVSGTVATTRVPRPGALTSASVPFTRPTRSLIENSPIPGRRSSARFT